MLNSEDKKHAPYTEEQKAAWAKKSEAQKGFIKKGGKPDPGENPINTQWGVDMDIAVSDFHSPESTFERIFKEVQGRDRSATLPELRWIKDQEQRWQEQEHCRAMQRYDELPLDSVCMYICERAPYLGLGADPCLAVACQVRMKIRSSRMASENTSSGNGASGSSSSTQQAGIAGAAPTQLEAEEEAVDAEEGLPHEDFMFGIEHHQTMVSGRPIVVIQIRFNGNHESSTEDCYLGSLLKPARILQVYGERLSEVQRQEMSAEELSVFDSKYIGEIWRDKLLPFMTSTRWPDDINFFVVYENWRLHASDCNVERPPWLGAGNHCTQNPQQQQLQPWEGISRYLVDLCSYVTIASRTKRATSTSGHGNFVALNWEPAYVLGGGKDKRMSQPGSGLAFVSVTKIFATRLVDAFVAALVQLCIKIPYSSFYCVHLNF